MIILIVIGSAIIVTLFGLFVYMVFTMNNEIEDLKIRLDEIDEMNNSFVQIANNQFHILKKRAYSLEGEIDEVKKLCRR